MSPATASTLVTATGQATLDRGLLDQIGARPGDRLRIVALPGGHLDVAVDPDGPAAAGEDRLDAAPARTGSWDAFFGSIKNNGSPPLTIEEMNEVIAKGWAGELDDCD